MAFHTFGCRLNQSETAALRHQFHQAGFFVSDAVDGSDIVVVNTCTVTENGDADTRRLVSRLVRENPGVSIALIGCQAQIQQGALFDWPNVKWVVGSANKMNLARIMQAHPDGVLDVPKPARTSFEIGALADRGKSFHLVSRPSFSSIICFSTTAVRARQPRPDRHVHC